MQHLSIETIGFSKEKEALEGGLRGGYYGGYFEHYVIRDISYGLWTDARCGKQPAPGGAKAKAA